MKISLYPVKHLESLSDLILGILVVRLVGHYHEELGEINHPGPVLVHLVHHVLNTLYQVTIISEDDFQSRIFVIESNYHITFSRLIGDFLKGSEVVKEGRFSEVLTWISASAGFCPKVLRMGPTWALVQLPSALQN